MIFENFSLGMWVREAKWVELCMHKGRFLIIVHVYKREVMDHIFAILMHTLLNE